MSDIFQAAIMIHMLIKTKLYTFSPRFSLSPLNQAAQSSSENWYPLLEAMEMIIASALDTITCV